MKNWRILIYGNPGTGIEELSSLAPNPVYIPLKDRGVTWIPRYDKVCSLEQLKTVLSSCAENASETVILDNLSSLERLISDELIGRDTLLYELPYGVGEGRLKVGFRDVLDRMKRMEKNVILLANQTQNSVPGTLSLAPVPCRVPEVHRCVYGILDDWLDALINLELEFEGSEDSVRIVRSLYEFGCPTRKAYWKLGTKDMPCPLPADRTVFDWLEK